MDGEAPVYVKDDAGIVAARQRGRALAAAMGFSATDSTLIATAISEIARNMVVYGKGGEIAFAKETLGKKQGLVVRATDRGPGIADVDQAMQDGFSTGKGLGLGLPGARRLMDEFKIESTVGVGTTIVMKKWVS
jgi:serine/threonine-protein kinase RsbT